MQSEFNISLGEDIGVVNSGGYIMEKTPELLFHYTNFVALEGILFGEGIRLCCSSEMNDAKEIKHFIQMLESSTIKYCEISGRTELVPLVEKLFLEQKEKRKDEVVYLTSFSEWEDDAAQWERYGNSGYGVSIGFDLVELKKVLSSYYIMCQKVFYGRRADEHQLIKDIFDIVVGKFPTTHGFDNADGVFDNAWGCAAAHKNPSFESEREYRMMTLPSWKGKRHDGLGEFKMVTTPSQIKRCLYFDWKIACEDHQVPHYRLIKRIVIGPRSRQSVDGLKEWLICKGEGRLADCVVKSESSLR